jgi:hypothetical protein
MFLVILFWPFYDSRVMAAPHSRPVRFEELIACSASFQPKGTAHFLNLLTSI